MPSCAAFVVGKEPSGTLWIVSNNDGHFDSGHARVMTELAQFAGIAFAMVQAEQRLKQALEQQEHLAQERFLQIAQMNRSLNIGAMSGAIAHELNQPLAAIVSNAEAAEILLTKERLDIKQLKDIVADIRNSGSWAGVVINHLRGFLKNGELELCEVDVHRVIADVLPIIESWAAKRGVIDAPREMLALAVRADHVHL